MRFRIYESHDGWRWSLISRNHKVLGDSGEAYSSKWNCRVAVLRVKRGALMAKVVAS
jgi:uncharacterized protein YegP (UPF0339 family)